MEREAEDVLYALRFTDDDMGNYGAIKSKFQGHFVTHCNIIYKTAKFNMCKEEVHKTTEIFITDIHNPTNTCECGALKDDLI